LQRVTRSSNVSRLLMMYDAQTQEWGVLLFAWTDQYSNHKVKCTKNLQIKREFNPHMPEIVVPLSRGSEKGF
jgi:hypothetical protein